MSIASSATRWPASASRTVPPPPRGALTWIGWMVGAAALGALVLGVAHFSEERELAALMERVQPAWLLLALVLQTVTYVAQGDVWRRVMRAGGQTIGRGEVFRLSLTKLFVDQALPSAGISGSIVVGRVLEQRGVPRALVMAGVVVNTISYHAANVLSLAVALVVVAARGRVSPDPAGGLGLVLALRGRPGRRHAEPGAGGPRTRKDLARPHPSVAEDAGPLRGGPTRPDPQAGAPRPDHSPPARHRAPGRGHRVGPAPRARRLRLAPGRVRQLRGGDARADAGSHPGRHRGVRGGLRRHALPDRCRAPRRPRRDAPLPGPELLAADDPRAVAGASSGAGRHQRRRRRPNRICRPIGRCPWPRSRGGSGRRSPGSPRRSRRTPPGARAQRARRAKASCRGSPSCWTSSGARCCSSSSSPPSSPA